MEWYSTHVRGAVAPKEARRRALEAFYPERSRYGTALRVESEAQYRCLESYSFAIPHFDLLKTLADRSPHGLLELGAGSGYWSHLLSLLDVDVLAVDHELSFEKLWHPVIRQDGREAARNPAYAKRTLFLCWPDEAWAPDCVKLSSCDTLAYVGAKGCVGTGGEALAAEIRDQWSPEVVSPMPNWYGESTLLAVYTRRSEDLRASKRPAPNRAKAADV
jgi:hypothetical protein